MANFLILRHRVMISHHGVRRALNTPPEICICALSQNFIFLRFSSSLRQLFFGHHTLHRVEKIRSKTPSMVAFESHGETLQKLPRITSNFFLIRSYVVHSSLRLTQEKINCKTPHHLSHFQFWEKVHFKNSRFVVSTLSFSFVKEKVVSKLLAMCCNACTHSFNFCSHRNACY